MGILHTALATLKLATATPDAAEINDYVADAHKEAKTEQINFASEIITTNTHDKVLAITDFSKSREKLDTEPTPEEIKKANDVVAEITKLTDNDVINKYIKEHSSEWNETIINLMISKITEKENDYLNKSVQWADEESSIVGAGSSVDDDADIRKAKATREKHYFYAKTNTMRAIIAKLKSIIAKKDLQELDKNFAENGVTVEQIQPGSQLDKDLKALGMKVFKEKDVLGYENVYVEIDGKKVEVATEEFDKEYFIISRKNGEEIIVSFKKIKKEAGKIYYTEFRENSAKNLVEKWAKYPATNFKIKKSYNLKPINNQDTNNSIGYNR
jgi:hypothetical protein